MKYVVTINDKSYEIEVEKGVAQVLSVKTAEPSVVAQPQAASQPQMVVPPQVVEAPKAQPVQTVAPAPQVAGGGETITAPMPGIIVSLNKAVGDTVKKGETVLVLEAMKMENEIASPKDGVIAQILTSKGSSVNSGDPLVVIS